MNASPQTAEEILRARARALAQAAETPAGAATMEVLEFRLAQERYAIETRFLQEVIPFRELTPLPCTPAFVLGIVNVRGHFLPVLNLKKFFDLPEKGITDLHRIVSIRSQDVTLGLLADVVIGLRHIETARLQPSLSTLTGIRAHYLKGVTDERLVVLDVEHLLSDPRILVEEEVEGS